MTTVEMQVHMDCPGCESKVRNALLKLKGVDNVDIDMAMQKVTVTGWADQKKVLKTVRKTGRRAEIWQLPYNPELNGPLQHYTVPQPTSSYNYYKHGCDSNAQGYYNNGYSTQSSIFGSQTGSVFNDENPNACSIM